MGIGASRIGLAALVIGSAPVAASAEDLFSVVRRAPAPPAKVSDPTNRVTHVTVYNTTTPRGGETSGVGLYATAHGEAVDLTAPDRMLDGPSGSLFSQAAGVGWRRRNVSAMVGYMKPSSVRSATRFEDDTGPAYRTRARFGVGWALHF